MKAKIKVPKEFSLIRKKILELKGGQIDIVVMPLLPHGSDAIKKPHKAIAIGADRSTPKKILFVSSCIFDPKAGKMSTRVAFYFKDNKYVIRGKDETLKSRALETQDQLEINILADWVKILSEKEMFQFTSPQA